MGNTPHRSVLASPYFWIGGILSVLFWVAVAALVWFLTH